MKKIVFNSSLTPIYSMNPKNMTILGFCLIVFASFTAASTNQCNFVSFIEERHFVEGNNPQQVFFRIQNNSDLDLYIDSVGIERNYLFNSQGVIVDKKIFGFNSGRVGAFVYPSQVEDDVTFFVNVSMIGHFENGERCFLNKDFIFTISPKQKEIPIISGNFVPFDLSEDEPEHVFVPVDLSDESSNLIITGFSSKVQVRNNESQVWLVLKNTENEAKDFFVDIKNLPQGVFSSTANGTLNAGESRQINLLVSGETNFNEFNGILFVESGNVLTREIVFEKVEQINAEPEQNVFVVGFSVLSRNTVWIVAVLLALILAILILLPRNDFDKKQVWVNWAN